MDSDSEDFGSCVSSDSGFLDGALEIDEALWEHDVCIKPRGFATEPPLNAPASASAPPDADLGEERNNVLRELLEQVPEVELPWFLDHALPKLDPEVNIASLVEQMKQNGLINDEGHWALWDGHPISKHNAKENIAYNPFQTLAEKICAQSGLGRTRKQTVAFVCIPDQPATQETRSNTSKPDCAAILLKDDGTPVWKPRPKPPSKDKDGSGKAKKSKGDPPTSQMPDASAPQSKPPKEKRVKTEEEKQIDRERRKEKQEREKEHTLRWLDMAAPGEFKLDGNNPKYAHDNQKKILWSLAYVLREDPRRRFVHGFTIEDTTMRLWFCSRSDVLVSKPFDFMKDHETTVRFILSISFATRVQLGWDPTIKVVQGTEGADIKFDIEVRDHVTGNIRTFRTMRILSNIGADAVRGRGTRVWEVCELDKDGKMFMQTVKVNGKPTEVPVLYALKDSWIDDNRWLEGEVMDKVYGKDEEEDLDDDTRQGLDELFMHYVTHGKVYIRDEPDHTRAVMLDCPKLPEHTSALHVPVEYSARAQVVSKLPAIGSMALARGTPKAPPLYTGKVHYRIVYKEVGETLFSVTSMSDIFYCLAEVTRGIGLLYSRRWIHRDISAGNILIVNGVPKISDLEYAKPIVDDSEPHGIRTGTIFFMSTEVRAHAYQYWQPPNRTTPPRTKRSWAKRLPKGKRPTTPAPEPQASMIADIPFQHNVLHDAESVFWLGLYMLLIAILKLPKGTPREVRERYTKYQKAQHALATQAFCHQSFRIQAMSFHGYLLRQANSLDLHPRVLDAIKALELIRAEIFQTFVQAERDLHVEPHKPNLDGVDAVLDVMMDHFLALSADLEANDIAIKPRSKIPNKLQNAVKGAKSKRKPDDQSDEDDDNPAKKVKTDDGPVASSSNAGISVDADVFGRILDPEASDSVVSSSRTSGSSVPSSRVSSSYASEPGASSSRPPTAGVEKTPKQPKRTGKGKEVARE